MIFENKKSSLNARVLLPMCLIALNAAPAAIAQHRLWITQFGTRNADLANAVVPDGVGGVFVVGKTSGPIAGLSGHNWDGFVAHFDMNGELIWIKQIGSADNEQCQAAAADGAGGVYIAGHTDGNLAAPNAGKTDAFLTQFDASGNQLWTRQIGTSEDDFITDLVPDAQGGLIITGWTLGDLGQPNAGSRDAFVARYDRNGNAMWIRQFGTTAFDWASSIMADGAGGVFLSGATDGNLAAPLGGVRDSWLARYDEDGNRIWIRQFDQGYEEGAQDLVSDGAGGLLVAGITRKISAGNLNAFLARYAANGDRVWLRTLDSNSFDVATALAPDGQGGAVLTGYTIGNLGGPNAGQRDIFVAHCSSTGEPIWIRQLGTPFGDKAFSVAFDGAGGIVVTGMTFGSLGGTNSGFPNTSDAILARFELDSCYPDCDRSTGAGTLDIFDFLCWQSNFVAGNAYACNCDTTTGPLVCDIFDFLCFQNAFVTGCP